MESIFCWYPGRYFICRMANSKSSDAFRSRTYSSLFCAELLRLSFRLLPLLWISTLFFLSFFFSKPEQRASVITHATPVNPLIYAVIRCSAVFVGSLLLIVVVFLLAAVFYGRFFHWYHWKTLLIPGCLILIPILLIDILIGWFIGQKFPWLLLIWMLIPVFIIIVIL